MSSEPQRLTLVPFDPKNLSSATIVSVFPFPPVNESRPGLPWINIRACDHPMDGYVTYIVTDRIIQAERGDLDGNYINFVVTAREIANDIIENVKDRGIFVAEGDLPTEEELAKARRDLRAYAEKMVGEGDEIWNRYGKRHFVSRHSVWAVSFLGQEREWAYEVTGKVETLTCTCGAAVRATAARCPKCSYILDWDRAAAGGLLDVENMKFAAEHKILDPLRIKQFVVEYQLTRERAARASSVPLELGTDAVDAEEVEGLADPLTPAQKAHLDRVARTGKRINPHKSAG